MNTPPYLQEILTALDDLGDETSQFRALVPDARYQFGSAIGPKQIDFRLSRSGNVDMRGFVIERVDREPEAVSAMDDNHPPT